MCGIYGFVGRYCDKTTLNTIALNAKRRGRDGGGIQKFTLENGNYCVLGNWRAAPTPELREVKPQPYNGLVHNGTIANDKELGGSSDQVDSLTLSKFLNRQSAETLAASLQQVKGSFAIACHNSKTLFLACNYKPLHYWSSNGVNYYFSSTEQDFEDAIPPWSRPVQLAPYSVYDVLNEIKVELPRTTSCKVVMVCSAGLDSTTAAYKLKSEGYEVTLLHFLYGCNAQSRELDYIKRIADKLESPLVTMQVPFSQMSGSSPILNQNAKIAETIEGAEFAHEWVPARNLVFLSLAVAYAEANNIHAVAIGNNLEEAGAYPDNEEQFTTLFDAAMPYAVKSGYSMRVLSPLGNLMKHEIVKLGLKLKVPFELTWSCYSNGGKHCGRCGPCFMRKTAFERNGTTDPVFKEIQ